ISAGYWSTYWYGGYIYGTEIARGLDVFALEPSDYLTENEIAAASLRETDLIVNAQTQQRIVWPDIPVVALAYLDQLLRSNVISAARADQLSSALISAQDLLDRGVSNDSMANQLVSLANDLAQESFDRSGTSRARYLALAETVESIATELR
ncbi:MAG: DUF305 domain-containing protein, partial [Pseudomonadota bacterium]|nr:DUF305 domain-containing protein [Pseudomonadota bacterium]